MAEPVTVYQPWRCEACGAKGCVEALTTDDAGYFARKALEEHFAATYGNCKGPIRFTGQWQLTKPAKPSSTHSPAL